MVTTPRFERQLCFGSDTMLFSIEGFLFQQTAPSMIVFYERLRVLYDDPSAIEKCDFSIAVWEQERLKHRW